jgi:cysteine-rich repeat protein
MRAGCLGVLAMAACVRSASVTCDDGTVCPEGTRCVAGGCSSLACGDGRLDLDLGETCDDSNHQSHDGCSSLCRIETPVWHAYDGAHPPARVFAAAAWEADAGRAILVGGEGEGDPGPTLADVWVWTAAAGWQPSTLGPPALENAALAPDGVGHVVLIGGWDKTLAVPHCWRWDGAAWTSCDATLPFVVIDGALAQSPVRGEVIGHGGDDQANGAQAARTLRWDGEAPWTSDTSEAPRRLRHAMIYEAAQHRVVMAGGLVDGQRQTLTFNGMWTQLEFALEREYLMLAYDADRAHAVTFGGERVEVTEEVFGDVHELIADEWRALAVAGDGPFPRVGGVLFHDAIGHQVVLFGGQSGVDFTVNDPLPDTWLLRWESDPATPEDACDGSDADGDGVVGCEDPDCWARCTPRCPFGTACDPADPHCGDGACNPALEDHALCPLDCP